jgi:thioredoxin-like negative regulator of GroEL
MNWPGRKKSYDRSRLLKDAARATKKGKRQKAIALYRELLAVESDNPDLHRKIAPLLAETKQPAEAWASYRRVAEKLVGQGLLEQVAEMLREASALVPREPEVWKGLADLELRRGRPADAHKVLLEGRQHFRSRRDLSHAVALLFRARKLAPRDFGTNYDLAGLLAKAGARERALSLLEEIASWANTGQLRRVRARQFALAPTPAAAWGWLRVIVVRG